MTPDCGPVLTAGSTLPCILLLSQNAGINVLIHSVLAVILSLRHLTKFFDEWMDESVSTNWRSNKDILCITMCNNNNTNQITVINALQCNLCTTSRTSSACRAMEKLSHYPVPVRAGHAGGYPAISGSGRISQKNESRTSLGKCRENSPICAETLYRL